MMPWRNGCIFIYSSILILACTAGASPTIVNQPTDITVVKGGRGVFSVYATGAGTLAYEWKRNALPITGATNAALVINPVQYSDAVLYAVDVTDSNGTTTSSAAQLSVDALCAGNLDYGFFTNTTIVGSVYAVAVQTDGKILIGGDFSVVNGNTCRGIARLNSDGSTDYSFGNILAGVNGYVKSIALQSDGKVLIGGWFASVNGAPRGCIARLNVDGSLDIGFGDGQVGTDADVNSVALQSDGKVLIGGWFSSVNGTLRGYIARLNCDGSLDTDFGNNLAGADNTVFSVSAQGDGKVLIGGWFSSVNGTSRGYMARLNSDGSLDTGFGNGLSGANATVFSVSAQGDGKVLIGGDFSLVNGVSRGCIARLNTNGSLDTGFGNGLAGANNGVLSVATQSDGKVLIGGRFTSVNGASRGRVARLNSNGSLDAGFGGGLTGADTDVNSVVAQSDGHVLIGGSFSSVNNTSRGCIARLNSDSSLKTDFGHDLVGANDSVYSLAVQGDGKALIGGWFSSVNGAPRGCIARLNSDGSLDTGFGNGLAGAVGYVQSVAMQSDGKVLIGGGFSLVNGVSRRCIARLNSDGSLDDGFGKDVGGANNTVYSVTPQGDGKVLIGGRFTAVGGTSRGYIARLNSDGSLDTGFGNGLAGANGSVYSVAVQNDGKVLVGGALFTINGTPCGYIARLNSDGSTDTSFCYNLSGANSHVRSVTLQNDGKVLIGGWFSSVNGVTRGHVARLNTDGSLDTSFGNGLCGANNMVYSVALQHDGKVLIGGYFSSVNGIPRGGIARLNCDGSLDAGFGNDSIGVDNIIYSVAQQGDDKILIGGSFSTVNNTLCPNLARLEGVDSDLDCDGMPDWWELRYFGDPVSALAFSLSSNKVNTVYESYIANLDPTNPTASFSVAGWGTSSSRGITLFSSSQRLYTLQWRDSLTDGDWSNVVAVTDIPGTDSTLTLSDPTSPLPSQRFYRVIVRIR